MPHAMHQAKKIFNLKFFKFKRLPGYPVDKTVLLSGGAQVQFLIEELKSLMP